MTNSEHTEHTEHVEHTEQTAHGEHAPRENPGPQDMGTDGDTSVTAVEHHVSQDDDVDADAGVTPRENPGPQD